MSIINPNTVNSQRSQLPPNVYPDNSNINTMNRTNFNEQTTTTNTNSTALPQGIIQPQQLQQQSTVELIDPMPTQNTTDYNTPIVKQLNTAGNNTWGGKTMINTTNPNYGMNTGTGSSINELDVIQDLTTGQKISMLTSFILSIAAVALVLVWLLNYRGGLVWEENNSKMFNLHVMLGVIGFAFFFTQSLIIFRSFPKTARYNRALNAWMYIFNFVCIGITFYAVTEAQTSPHLHTLHSWLGIASSFLFLVQAITAIISYIAPNNTRLTNIDGSSKLVPYHAFFAVLSYCMGLMTLATGVQQWITLLQNGRDHYYLGQPLLANTDSNADLTVVGINSDEAIIANVLGLVCYTLVFSTLYFAIPRYVLPNYNKSIPLAPPINTNLMPGVGHSIAESTVRRQSNTAATDYNNDYNRRSSLSAVNNNNLSTTPNMRRELMV